MLIRLEISLILSAGAIVSSVVASYFIWRLYSKMALLSKDVKEEFSELNINSQLSSMFSQDSSNKSVDELTKKVFDSLKKKFSLEAKSYSGAIQEIKLHTAINADLKEVLVSFFEEIIRISYRAEVISEEEKDDLKNKIKLILEILN